MLTIQNINFYTVQEVAKELGISPLTVRNYIKTGRLKGQRIGRPVLITEEAVKEFLQGKNESNNNQS